MRQELLLAIVTSFGLAAALPAIADTDADFLREMARTDGNPLGDYAIPEEAAREAGAKIDEAFLFELARTDGNTAVNVAEEPAQEIVTAQK